MKALKTIFKFFAWICILMVLSAGLILLYSRYIAPYQLKTVETAVTSPYITETADGIRIIEFGDTHLGEYYDLEQFQKVVSAINAEEPDIVIFSGDLIDSFHDYKENTAELSALLSQINAPYGKYCVFGNHDYGGGAESEYPGIMADGGFTLLLNDNHQIPELNLNIIGIDDVLIGYGDVTAAGKTISSDFNMVIAHEPDIADEVSKYDIDLMLAGHTHGRQINIKYLDGFILPPYGKKYVEGRYDFESARNMALYVTKGIGTTQLPLRFNSTPELSGITLERTAIE